MTNAAVPISSPVIEKRGRASFLEGVESQSQAAEGRPLTADELERITSDTVIDLDIRPLTSENFADLHTLFEERGPSWRVANVSLGLV